MRKVSNFSENTKKTFLQFFSYKKISSILVMRTEHLEGSILCVTFSVWLSIFSLPWIVTPLAISPTFIYLKTDHSGSFSISLDALSLLCGGACGRGERGLHTHAHMCVHFNKKAILIVGNTSSPIGTYTEPTCVHPLLFVLVQIWSFHFSTSLKNEDT